MKMKKNALVLMMFAVGGLAAYTFFNDQTTNKESRSSVSGISNAAYETMEGDSESLVGPGVLKNNQKDFYFGIKNSIDSGNEIQEVRTGNVTVKNPRPGIYDDKRKDPQAIKNLKLVAYNQEQEELKKIDEEISYDEVRLAELVRAGDNENATYLEGLIAQKRARASELQ